MRLEKYADLGESLYRGELDNGLRVMVLKKPGFAKSCAYFATDYGGADRRFRLDGRLTDTPAGVAHFLEHKMFDMPDGTNALSVLSGRGASPNAYTSSRITAYHFECTGGFAENLRTLLTFVSTPYFTAESVEKEQGIIGQEIRMTEDNPDHALYYSALRCLYAENPVRDSVAGTVDSIAEITPETLYGCHRAFYAPSNMVLCAVGDVDPEDVISAAGEILPPQRAEKPLRDSGEAFSPEPAVRRSTDVMEVSAPRFYLAAKLAPPEDGAGRMRTELTGNLALQALVGRSSPFYTRLYADGLLKDDFDFELDCSDSYAHVLLGGESPDPERVAAELSAEVARIREHGLDAGYFRRVHRSLTGGLLRQLDSFPAMCYALASAEFAGYNAMDVYAAQAGISADMAVSFIGDVLSDERLAMAVVKK